MTAAIQDFATYFRGQQAQFTSQPDVMDEIYRLRYDVYCTECGYRPASDCPDGREVDAFDVHSGHFYALDASDRLIGYVRLVSPDGEGRFPLDLHGLVVLDTVVRPDPGQTAEISRLMVHKNYRRRRGDRVEGVTLPMGDAPPEERRNSSPQIMLCLFKQMYGYSVESGIRYWYAAMEGPLAKVLTRMGFGFKRIGPETDYYGPVAPFLADLRELERNVGSINPDLLAWMQSD